MAEKLDRLVLKGVMQSARDIVRGLEELLHDENAVDLKHLAAKHDGKIVGASQGEFVVKFKQPDDALKFVAEYHDLTGEMLWYPEGFADGEWIVKVDA